VFPYLSVSYDEFFTRFSPGTNLVIFIFGVLFGLFSEENSDSARCLSPRIIDNVRNFSARNNASDVFSIVSVGFPGATTILGNSPCPARSAISKSDCAVYVGTPVPGPGLEARYTVRGISDIPWRDSDSPIKSNPPPDVPVIVFAPVNEAPNAMLAAAISFSAWNTIRLFSTWFFARACIAFVAGVIGYAIYKSRFEFLAPIATASLPDNIDTLFFIFFKLKTASCDSNPFPAALTASSDSLNCDLISLSNSSNGIPNIFVNAPASAMFRFLPSFLN